MSDSQCVSLRIFYFTELHTSATSAEWLHLGDVCKDIFDELVPSSFSSPAMASICAIKYPVAKTCQVGYLRCDELQATALPVLLPLQQIPHLRVILSQAFIACPWTIFIDNTSGSVGLLGTYAKTNWGPLAQGLWAERIEGKTGGDKPQ